MYVCMYVCIYIYIYIYICAWPVTAGDGGGRCECRATCRVFKRLLECRAVRKKVPLTPGVREPQARIPIALVPLYIYIYIYIY